MLSITSYTSTGARVRLDLHDLKLPTGELAHTLPGAALFQKLSALKVPGIGPNMGDQLMLQRFWSMAGSAAPPI